MDLSVVSISVHLATVFPGKVIGTIFMPTQSWAGSRYRELRIPGLVADGWVDCTAHPYLVSPYSRREQRCTVLVRKALIAFL